jgi:hypothetical protein
VNTVTALGIVLAAALLAAGVLIVLTRRTHLRSWRFGLFYESEDRYDDKEDE